MKNSTAEIRNYENIYITSDEELVIGGYHFNSKYGEVPQKTVQRDIDSRVFGSKMIIIFIKSY